MTKPPRDLIRRFALYTTLSWALAPVMGYVIAVIYGGLDANQIQQPASLLILIPYLILLVWAGLHFRNFLTPVYRWMDKHPHGGTLPDALTRHIQGFCGNYWSFHLLAIFLLPTTQHWAGISTDGMAPLNSLLNFMLFQLVIAILVGMPGYLMALSLLGKLGQYTGTTQQQMSMKTKLLLVGGYIPLLTTTAMVKYYWWKTHYLSPEIMLAWALLGLSGFVITVLAIRSLAQSLRPVENAIGGSGATTYGEMAARLYPQSTDEIGYMVQMLGKLFRRLGDQDSYVNAVIENTAEAIIVINDKTEIETFNPAAEQLFGYPQHEIIGQPVSWLLPAVNSTSIQDICGTHESFGKRSHGKKFNVAMKIKAMQTENDIYYTCLVSDISERKAAELKLMEAEARYRDLVETAHDLVWSMDLDGRWTYLNNAAQRIYGYSVKEMLGKSFTDFQAKESTDKDMAAFAKVLEGKELLQYETLHLDRDGNPKHISFNAKPLYDENGNAVRITGTARDITEQKIFERELTYQAQHDSLTGLYNRNYFQQELQRLVSRAARNGAACALLYLDLDQFKYVNDTLGHAAGDRLLLECTSLLKSHVREGDLLARFGGDEFTILLYNVNRTATERVAENIRQLFESYRFMDSGKTFNVTCSIGITMVNSETSSVDDALSQADLACNISKTQGRNCIHTYKPSDYEKSGMAEDIGWATRVRDAVDKDRFHLVYQPIMSVASGEVMDYEVLLRMKTDNGTHIMPSGFMPAAERFGLVNHVDRWTVRTAIKHLAHLHENGIPVRFSINLSGHAFGDNQLLPMINSLLNDTRIEPSALTFEITETAAIADMQAAMRFITQLKDIGCQFALDDFGSGFCSFTYLKHLPVDKLKIDGAFVQSLPYTNVDQAMVQSMNQIAHALGKQTIAEFVENQATLDLLRKIGVDYAQGNFLGKPGSSLLAGVQLLPEPVSEIA
ncbi:MAG: EAL domain-containing protein [Gammaproteobacteria bacterium]|nr:EAL domain-containing protein [Gammaproteobacteria bacterium]MDH5654062.1 EAL domain-containing protein [Gammaproteobacteria bacterium]